MFHHCSFSVNKESQTFFHPLLSNHRIHTGRENTVYLWNSIQTLDLRCLGSFPFPRPMYLSHDFHLLPFPPSFCPTHKFFFLVHQTTKKKPKQKYSCRKMNDAVLLFLELDCRKHKVRYFLCMCAARGFFPCIFFFLSLHVVYFVKHVPSLSIKFSVYSTIVSNYFQLVFVSLKNSYQLYEQTTAITRTLTLAYTLSKRF